MENNKTNDRIIELSEPTRRVVKSDTVLYILVVLFVFAALFLASFLIQAAGVPALPVTLFLYAGFAAVIIWLFRYRFVSYRYTATDRMLVIDRLVGKKEKPEVQMHLSDIRSVRQFSDEIPGKSARLYHGKKELTTVVVYRAGKTDGSVLISVSDSFRNELVKRWKAAKK